MFVFMRFSHAVKKSSGLQVRLEETWDQLRNQSLTSALKPSVNEKRCFYLSFTDMN